MATEPVPALDSAVHMQATDKRNMLRLINELPEQCETALGIARNFSVEPDEVAPTGVFITGVGDSGLVADMAAAVMAGEAEVPVISSHGGRLPKYVGEGTLVLVVDYTGKSQSEIRSLREAKHRGARVICVTTGGKLLETANNEEVRVLKIPPGQPGRSAVGYLFVPLIVAMEKFGVGRGQIEQLSHAIKLLKNVREALRFENPTKRNTAKQTAETIFGKTAVIYGAPGYRSILANRWKGQLAANSKLLAIAGVFPDVAMSEISGWESARDRADQFAAIMLRDSTDKSEVTELMNASAEVLAGFPIVQVDIRGATIIEKVLYGVYLGDYISYYLALLGEVNPSTTEFASLVDERLAAQAVPPAQIKPEQITEAGGE